MLIVTIMLAVIIGMILHFTSRNLEEQGNRMLQTVQDAPFHTGAHMDGRRIPYFTVFVTKQGVLEITSDYFFPQEGDRILHEIAEDAYKTGRSQGLLRNHHVRFSRRQVPAGEQIAILDVSVEQGMMNQLLETCISISIAGYILFFGISVLLAQWAVHPVEQAWKQQRQFIADASHELKTPLTVIMTNAELLQDGGYGTELKHQFADGILLMAQQMRGLVEGLLELARVDNGVVKTVFTEVNVSNLVENSLLVFEPVLFEKGQELKTHIEPGIYVCGSESHLRQVMDILLDNASKYGDPSQPVHANLHRQGRHAQVCISTAGDEISREDLKNIFKRFYRIDKARVMNQSYGLGLSIAEGIVREHGGRIRAVSKNGINSFYVQLPVLLLHE